MMTNDPLPRYIFYILIYDVRMSNKDVAPILPPQAPDRMSVFYSVFLRRAHTQ